MTVCIATGRRDKLITFSRRTVTGRTTVKDISGYTWASLGTRWGRIKTESGTELEVGGQVKAVAQMQAIFPFLSGLTTQDKATFDSVDYGIDALEDRDGAGIEHVATLRTFA